VEFRIWFMLPMSTRAPLLAPLLGHRVLKWRRELPVVRILVHSLALLEN
jgi:hypothetical protein